MENIKKSLESIESFEFIGGVKAEEIKKAEETLNLKFAEEFKEYLKLYGTAFCDHMELTGLNIGKRINVVDVTIKERGLKDLPQDMYVIENLGIDGILILQNASGKIFEIDAYDNVKEIYKSLSAYILSNKK